MKLSEKSRAILEAIAKGHTYEQILIQDLAWTYHDIFRAAEEALAMRHGSFDAGDGFRLDLIRAEHPQAYRKWDAAQDDRLEQLFRSGSSEQEIAMAMQRQPGGVRSRLKKLGLIPG